MTEIALFLEEKDSLKLLFWEWHSLLSMEENEWISFSVIKGYLRANLILGYHHKPWIPGVRSIGELQIIMKFLLQKNLCSQYG